MGGHLQPAPFPPGVSFGPIDSLTSDSFDSIWFSDGPRLFRWRHGHLAQIDTIQASSAQISLLYADSSDRLWVAFKDGHVEVLDSATGQPHNGFHGDAVHQTVYDIWEDSSHILWIRSRGLTRFSQGRFATLVPDPHMFSSTLGAIVGDEDELWLNTGGGLLRLSRKAFEAAVEVPTHPLHYQSYDTADGVAGAPIVKLAARRDGNGRLWFARGGALTSVTPMPPVDRPPPVSQLVRIEGVVTDDGVVRDLSNSVLAAGTRRVEINYTALALTAPNKIRFRYRLDGLTKIVDAGTGRQAIYTNLAPGGYVFRVEASASDGRWMSSSATWRFRREPRFVQTRGFYVGSVALFGLCAVGLWKLRLRRVHREFAAVLAERLRLSREIHDTLLQNLVGLALQFDVLAEGLETLTADAKSRLVRIRKQVDGYVREARQAIYELRTSSPPACPDLAMSLTEFGARTAGGTPTFESSVEGDPPEYSANLRRALIRIGQEAITNAVRHADAKRIRLDVRFETTAISLNVADDGCGFDVGRAQSETDDHYGLLSMRERAEDVGAHLDIVSEKGRGTIVTLRAPLLDV
jgi:signal transduction histidine kinase